MADQRITELNELAVEPAAGDWIVVVDIDASGGPQTKKVSFANFGAASALAELTDVDLTGQATGDLLFNVDGTNWQDTDGDLRIDIGAFEFLSNFTIVGSGGLVLRNTNGDVFMDNTILGGGLFEYIVAVGGNDGIRIRDNGEAQFGMSGGTGDTTLISGADIHLISNGSDIIANSLPPAFGGLEVNNTLTGTGLERVLTTSDSGGGAPSVTDEQTLVGVGTTLTASDFFKHDNSDIITMTNNFSQVFTMDMSSSGTLEFGGAGLSSVVINDATLSINAIGSANVALFNYTGTLFSITPNSGGEVLRFGNSSNQWTIEIGFQGSIVRWLESGGIRPVDVNNTGDHFRIAFNANVRGLKLDNNGCIYLQERANANADTAAFGQFWVRNDVPNTPMYTDDTGVDQVIDPSISEINTQDSSYALVLTDKGKTIRKTSATAAQTYTIPANASVAYKIGTIIGIQNDGSVSLSIAITTDTLTNSADGATGTRTLGSDGEASIQKVAATAWKIVGAQLS